jgi:hypothetical protein
MSKFTSIKNPLLDYQNDPEYKARMKIVSAKLRAEKKEQKEKDLELHKIAHEKYMERQRQKRVEIELLKSTNPELYAELYPPNVFKTSTAFE